MWVQRSAHLVEVGVGGAGVKTAPSARCLQMYFSLLVQGSTSQRPAKIPVVMATQPCWWPCIVEGEIVKYKLWSHFWTHLTEKNSNFFIPGISAFQWVNFTESVLVHTNSSMFLWFERPSQKCFSGLNPTKLTRKALSTLEIFTQLGLQDFLHQWMMYSRAEQLIAVLAKSQYGQMQYPNCRSCNFLIKVKCVPTYSYKRSIVVLQRCAGRQIIFSRCSGTCLFGTD